MRSAIQTKFIGPTNHRGSRVKAWCEQGSITVNWDHAQDVETNHRLVAKALAHKLDWDGYFFGGSLEHGYVFIRKFMCGGLEPCFLGSRTTFSGITPKAEDIA